MRIISNTLSLCLIALFLVVRTGLAQSCGGEIEVARDVPIDRSAVSLLNDTEVFEVVLNNDVVEGKSATNVWWLRIKGMGPDCDNAQWLRLKYPYLHEITAFSAQIEYSGNTAIQATKVDNFDTHAFLYPIVPLSSANSATAETYLVKIVYRDRLILPVRLASSSDILHEGFWFLVISLALIICLMGQAAQAISLGRLRSRPDRRAFILFALAAAAYVVVSSGILSFMTYGKDLFDPRKLLLITQAVLVWAAVEFLRHRSDEKPLKHIDGLLRSIQLMVIATVVLDQIGPQFASLAFLCAFLISPIALLALLVWSALRGHKGSIICVLAWTPTIFAVVWLYSRILGLTPYHPINHHLAAIGLFLTSLQFNALLTLNQRKDAHAADHDALTGLANRRAMERTASRAAEGKFSIHGIALIDLRKFKQVNDTYGHAAGDELLIQIAQRLRRVIHRGSQIYRIGGDEFAFVVTDPCSQSDFEQTLNKVRAEIELPFKYKNALMSVGASVGAVYGPIPSGVEFGNALKRADALAYEAKAYSGGAIVLKTWAELCLNNAEAKDQNKSATIEVAA